LKPFLLNYENVLYTLTSVGAMVHIAYNGGQASPIIASTVFKIFKIIRRSNYYQAFNQLIDSIIFTLSVMMSYSAIMVLFVYIFSLLGMQFFAGKLVFNEKGQYDPVNGTVPRQNFDTIIWSVTTVLQTLIGDDWSLVMFNCMLSTGWYSCIYFFILIIVGYIILMNLFQAILIGNFEEASLIMRDTQFLKNIQKVEHTHTHTNKIGSEGVPMIDFNSNRFGTHITEEEKLNPYAVLNQDNMIKSPPSGSNSVSATSRMQTLSPSKAVLVGQMSGPKPLIVVDKFLRSFKAPTTYKAGDTLKLIQSGASS
jgi:Ion transport protein